MIAYAALIALVAMERFAELLLARRHAAWARRRGGVEYGAAHYPWIVVLHAGLLVSAPLEVWLLHRPFIAALGWPMLALTVLAQGLRWWCIATLGRRWNTRVIVLPGLPAVRRGPYRHLRHPNYAAVILEGVALPLVHTAWLTAAVFTALDLCLLRTRVRVENAALDGAARGASPSAPTVP
jgi:methyltransferase